MMNSVLVLALLSLVTRVASECANACNGHGRCTSYDMCLCQRNWMGNDCSERVCQFGLAHVDTPKGDLDNSGGVLDARYPVIENNFVYPYGTTEAYPEMVDSNLNEIQDSAHYYMECSNKGTCNRKKGTCKCYPGYDGASCQRASCPGFPNSCSGHGVCKTIQQLANADNGNIYELWDRHMTMGCECDAGFYGPDCSKRRCKTGVDPLYLDDSATIKYPVWNVATLSHTRTAAGVTDSAQETPKDLFYNGMSEAAGPGYWALRFFDSNGEDWLTGNIPGGASCNTVKQALYDIPNNVIPADSVSCTIVTTGSDATPVVNPASVDEANDLAAIDYLGDEHDRPITYKFAFWETIADQIKFQAPTDNDDGAGGLPKSWESTNNQDVMGFVYRLKFFGNPGALREPEIEIYLDGDRPTLAAVDHVPTETAYSSTLITKVWTDGMQGEDKDYFADHCDGVTVNVRSVDLSSDDTLQLPKRTIHYLGMTAAESLLLKSCLGGADFSDHNNIDSYDWDYGSRKFPHIIKLVRSVTSATDGGHYIALIYKPYSTDGAGNTNLAGNGDTTGYFELVNPWLPLNTGTTDATPNSNDYEVYTTKGVLALVSEHADAFFGFGEKEMYTFNVEDEKSRETNVGDFHHYGSLSCEFVTSTGPNKQIKYRSQTHAAWDKEVNADGEQEEATTFEQVESAADWDTSMRGARLCLNKTDIIIPLAIPEDGGASYTWNEKTAADITEPDADPDGTSNVAVDSILNYNPREINMYTVEKIYTKDYVAAEKEVNTAGHHGVFDTDATETNKLLSNMWRNVIKTDLSTNWGTGAAFMPETDDATPDLLQGFRVYKFHPAAASTYEYVAQCSNRGLCDANSGVCNCFPGYGNDNCDEQNALAV